MTPGLISWPNLILLLEYFIEGCSRLFSGNRFSLNVVVVYKTWNYRIISFFSGHVTFVILYLRRTGHQSRAFVIRVWIGIMTWRWLTCSYTKRMSSLKVSKSIVVESLMVQRKVVNDPDHRSNIGGKNFPSIALSCGQRPQRQCVEMEGLSEGGWPSKYFLKSYLSPAPVTYSMLCLTNMRPVFQTDPTARTALPFLTWTSGNAGQSP